MPDTAAGNSPYPFSGPSPLSIVRERTRDLHLRLESAVDLTHSLANVDEYRLLLLRYLTVYEPFEDLLELQSSDVRRVVSLLFRSKVALLHQDLSRLPAPEPRHPSPASPRLPALASLDALLGALYVVEGSSLGGQMIYRQIQQNLGLDAASGAAFFYGDGDRTGSYWKQFTLLFERTVTSPERAAQAATAMFHAFEQALVLIPRVPGQKGRSA